MAGGEGSELCGLCCHKTSAWAFGYCDHPVCLTCCVRMRVLCDTKECPVCRVKLGQVTVSSHIHPYKNKKTDCKTSWIRKYGLLFENLSLREKHTQLLAYCCDNCPENSLFSTFKLLRDHIRKTHDLFFCEICVDNLKLFPFEFKTYKKQDLARHRREGDQDDTSYKGHPLCKFCDERFLNNDTLLSHLRRNHFWCHICESGGRQDYYRDYETLREHFKGDHFLCEEGDCKNEQFTSVFRNEIDLKAHKASQHRQGLSKTETKQLRQIDVGFTFTTVQGRGRRNKQNDWREDELLEAAATAVNTRHPGSKGKAEGSISKERDREKRNSIEDGSCYKPDEAVVVPLVPRRKPPGFDDRVVPAETEWPTLEAPGTVPPQKPPSAPPPGFLMAAKHGRRTLLPTPPEFHHRKKGQPFLPHPAGPVYQQQHPQHPQHSGTNGFNRATERQVISKVREILGDKFSTFKTLSGWFRNEEISVQEYNKQCLELFGPSWKELGPEIAMVLPVEEKQKELLSMFKHRRNRRSENEKSLVSAPKNAWGVSSTRRSNRKIFSDDEFPTLSATVQ